MKTLSAVLFVVLLGACTVPEASEVFDAGEIDGLSDFSQAITFPFSPKSRGKLFLYGYSTEGTVPFENEFNYALADGYPGNIAIESIAIARGCQAETKLEWTSVSELQGDAALVRIEANSLVIELRTPGTVQATLLGQIKNANCADPDRVMTTLPIVHRIKVNVRPIAGFVVLPWISSDTRLVIPFGARVTRPMVMPIDDVGNTFGADNAMLNGQAELTVLAPGGIARVGTDGDEVVFHRGTVKLQVAGPQSVQGLASFDVVGPEAITAFQEGFSIDYWQSREQFARLELEQGHVYEVTTLPRLLMKHGDVWAADSVLRDPPPASWFRFESMTPSVCVPNVSDDRGEQITIANFVKPGTCHFVITVPGTPWRWEHRVEIKLLSLPTP